MKKITLFLTVVFLLVFPVVVRAQTADELDKKIADLTAKISTAQNSAKTLASQISYYDDQIDLYTLKISQSQANILSISSKIDQLENSLRDKSRLLAVQISQSYKQGAEDPLQLFFSSSDFSNFVARFKYAQQIQETNRRFLYQTQHVQSNYAQQKLLVQDAKKKIEEQKTALTSLRGAKDSLLKQTKNDEANYQKLLSEAIAQRNAITSFIGSQGGASLLSNQTVCSDWGCYYNQRDSSWGGQTMGSSTDTLARYGCLVTSVSMIASHYGKSIKPPDIAHTLDAFYGNTGYLYYNITVAGININRTYSANIDSQLAAGKPVIVGVYNGPAHFVVLKSGSAGHYIMNDPYLENGHDVNFTDHYPLSSITYAGAVTVN